MLKTPSPMTCFETLFVYFILFIVKANWIPMARTPYTGERECPFYYDYPIKDNCNSCGICRATYETEDRTSKMTSYCDYDYFKTTFIPESRSSCELIDHCEVNSEINLCRSNRCAPMIGTFKCQCDGKRYGRLCQYDIKESVVEDLADINNILFTPMFTKDRFATFSVLFNSIGSSLELHVKTAREHIVYNSQMCINESLETLCTEWFDGYETMCKFVAIKYSSVNCSITIHLLFPSFTESDYEDVTWILFKKGKDDRVLALGETVNILVYNNIGNHRTAPIFESNYKVNNFIIYTEFTGCAFHVLIINGAKTMFEIVKISSRFGIVFTSLSYFPPHTRDNPKCRNPRSTSDEFILHWTCWTLGVNYNDIAQDNKKEIFEKNAFIFKPFELEVGKYKVQLNVSNSVLGQISFEIRFVYFQVVKLGQQATILGGLKRNVYYNSKYVNLDGSLSMDPNKDFERDHDNLYYHWECDKFDHAVSTSDIVTYPGPFKVNQTYKFTLTVTSRTNISDVDKVVQEIMMVPMSVPAILIMCLKNCGYHGFESNPEEIFYLKAIVDDIPFEAKPNDKFKWTYSKGDGKRYDSTDLIRQYGTPDNILIVLSNTLEEGVTYTFCVEGGADYPGLAKFKATMTKKPNNFSCKIKGYSSEPIIRGSSERTIVCDLVEFEDLTPRYDFYERYPNSDDKGRLLMSGHDNIASNIVFTRGLLFVEITNSHGMCSHAEITVPLTSPQDINYIIYNNVNELEEIRTSGDDFTRAKLISVVVDLLLHEKHNISDVPHLIERMLKVVYKNPVYNLEVVQIWTSTLDIVANEFLKITPTKESLYYTSKLLYVVADRLLKDVLHFVKYRQDITTSFILQQSKTLMSVCNAVYVSRNEDLVKKIIRQEELYDILHYYSYSTYYMMQTLEEVLLTLSGRIMPYENAFSLKSENITIWVKDDSPRNFNRLSEMKDPNKTTPSIFISKSLANSLSAIATLIVIDITVFNGNPYWWVQDMDINTNVVSLNIRTKKKNLEKITQLGRPVNINLDYLSKETTIVHGSVQQPDPEESEDIKDNRISIHNVRIETAGHLEMKFLNFSEEDLLVLVLLNMRPDYEFMMKFGRSVNKTNGYYMDVRVEAPITADIYDIYFIGILPGPNIPAGQSLNYTFELNTVHCVTWGEYSKWTTEGCSVREIKSKHLDCECEHLSSFAGFTGIPMNTVDPFKDHYLFLSVYDNPFVAIFIGSLLIVYFIALLWAARKDCRDRYRQCAVYLEDNISDDNCPYLVAVYTGSKLFSGTTSNVGIMIQGDKCCSRPHIFKSKLGKVLQRGDDNWFLVFTPSHLGELNMVHLWTDYTGRSPEWFCQKVIVVDLSENKEFVFLVNAWLSLKENESVERVVSADVSTVDKRMDIALDNLKLGFRENHLWMSVLSRHPRSMVSRAQRLSVAFTGLLVTMLVSCMFYGVIVDKKEDYSNYSVGEQEIIVGFVGMVISALLVNLVISVFRKTMLYQTFGKEDHEEVDHKVHHTGSYKHTRRASQEEARNIILRLFQAVLKLFARHKKYVPVHLNIDILGVSSGKNVASVIWSILAWSVCISMVIISSYLMVLYGFKFGKVKSLQWLTSVFMSVVQVVFIVTPLKIVTLAAMSGLVASNIHEVVAYNITCDLLPQYKRWYLNADPDLEHRLETVRVLPMYVPLAAKQMEKRRRKQKKVDAAWLLLDAVLIALVIAVMLLHSDMLWTTMFYWSNHQVTTLLRLSSEDESTSVNIITNLTEYPSFLMKKVFPLIYPSTWYNDQPFVPESLGRRVERYALSGKSRLYGRPRLRQIRLKPGMCRASKYALPERCPYSLNNDTEDTDIYSARWVTRGSYEKFVESSVWNYMDPAATGDPTIYGYSNTAYHGGGYVSDLKLHRSPSEDILFCLKEENWIDKQSRAVFFEMSLINVNAGTISWVVSVSESMYLGMPMTKVYVYSVSDVHAISTMDVVLFLSLLTFSIRVFIRTNRKGLNTIFYIWNVFEMMIVILGMLTAVLHIINMKKSSQYLENFSNVGDAEEYFQYSHLLTNLEEIRMVFVVLLIIIVCRFVKSLRFGKLFDTLCHTLLFSWVSLLWIFLAIMLLSFIYWYLLIFLLNEFMDAKHTLVIVNNKNFKQIVNDCNYLSCACKLVPLLISFMSYLLDLVIIIHFLHIFLIVKYERNEREVINMFTVFRENY